MTKTQSQNKPKNKIQNQGSVISDEPLIWVVSDGTAGMVAQALALAQAMDVSYFDVRIFASPIYRLFPQMGAWPLMPISPRRNDRRLGPPWPDIIITCGKRSVGASLAIKRLSGGKTKIVQIQDPKIDPSHFDVMICPQHDPISQGGLAKMAGLAKMIVSKGSLNRLKMTDIAREAKSLPKSLRAKKTHKTAVMVGGNNRRYKASADDFSRFGIALNEFAKSHDSHLVLIGSRRTPSYAMDAISASLGKVSHQIWDGKGDNPYPGILGVVDDVIVTSDSVNMASEVCLTGKPVYIAQLQEESGRIAAFHEMMVAQGHTKPLGQSFDDPPEILDEMASIADQTRKILGL